MPLKMHLTKLMEKLEMLFQIHGKIKNAFSKIRNAFPYFGNAFFMEMKMHMENPHLFSLRFQKFISKIKNWKCIFFPGYIHIQLKSIK